MADLIRSATGQNLGLLMRKMTGAGNPNEAASRGRVLLIVVYAEDTLAIFFIAGAARSGKDTQGFLILAVSPEPA